MKIIWSPALTLDGYIAKEDGDSDWVSEQDGEDFTKLIQECGAVVVGRTTYEQYGAEGDEAAIFPVPGATTFVYTRKPLEQKVRPGVAYVSGTPQEVVAMLEKRGLQRAVLAGGGKTNGAFAAAGLIDEVIVNIYPLIFGEGVPALGGVSCRLSLKLLGRQRLPGGIIRCHYQVVR